MTYLNFNVIFFFGIICYSLYIIFYYDLSYWFPKCEMLKLFAGPFFHLFQQFIRWKFFLWGWITVAKEILQSKISAQKCELILFSLLTTLSSCLMFNSRLLYKVIIFYKWRYTIEIFVTFNNMLGEMLQFFILFFHVSQAMVNFYLAKWLWAAMLVDIIIHVFCTVSPCRRRVVTEYVLVLAWLGRK